MCLLAVSNGPEFEVATGEVDHRAIDPRLKDSHERMALPTDRLFAASGFPSLARDGCGAARLPQAF
jgi:hypothetical protein